MTATTATARAALSAAQPDPASPEGSPWLAVDTEGAMARLRVERYDEGLIEQIRALPDRRFLRERREWVLPARRAALAQVAELVENLGERAQVSRRARRRLDRARPGRIEQRKGAFMLTFFPQPRRLQQVRALPERRYLPDRRAWTVPATRAGALVLLDLLTDGEFTATDAVAARLAQIASTRRGTNGPVDVENPDAVSSRASPTPHWRHYTRGPIYRANPQRREQIAGIGWCVRVRVGSPPRESSER